MNIDKNFLFDGDYDSLCKSVYSIENEYNFVNSYKKLKRFNTIMKNRMCSRIKNDINWCNNHSIKSIEKLSKSLESSITNEGLEEIKPIGDGQTEPEIVKYAKSIPDKKLESQAEEGAIEAAESVLNICFHQEYKDLCLNFNSLRCEGVKLTGINTNNPDDNVVFVTIKNWMKDDKALYNPYFYVIEEYGADGIIFWQHKDTGEIYETKTSDPKYKKRYNSLCEFLRHRAGNFNSKLSTEKLMEYSTEKLLGYVSLKDRFELKKLKPKNATDILKSNIGKKYMEQLKQNITKRGFRFATNKDLNNLKRSWKDTLLQRPKHDNEKYVHKITVDNIIFLSSMYEEAYQGVPQGRYYTKVYALYVTKNNKLESTLFLMEYVYPDN